MFKAGPRLPVVGSRWQFNTTASGEAPYAGLFSFAGHCRFVGDALPDRRSLRRPERTRSSTAAVLLRSTRLACNPRGNSSRDESPTKVTPPVAQRPSHPSMQPPRGLSPPVSGRYRRAGKILCDAVRQERPGILAVLRIRYEDQPTYVLRTQVLKAGRNHPAELPSEAPGGLLHTDILTQLLDT